MFNSFTIYTNISFIYIVFFILIIFVSMYIPEYLNNISSMVRNIICVALIIKYNPYTKQNITEQDTLIIFNSMILLLSIGFIVDATIHYLDKIQKFFKVF